MHEQLRDLTTLSGIDDFVQAIQEKEDASLRQSVSEQPVGQWQLTHLATSRDKGFEGRSGMVLEVLRVLAEADVYR
jgi:hypothetical protein